MTINEWSKHGYERMRRKLTCYANSRGEEFDDDIYHLTLLKTLEIERNQGRLHDSSEQGIDNYIFIAYKLNSLRDKQYPRVARTTYCDDLSIFDKAIDDGDNIYIALCNEFGCGRIDAIVDGNRPMDDEIKEYIYKNA